MWIICGEFACVLCIRAVHYLKVSRPVYFTGWGTDVYTYGITYQGCSLFEGKCTSLLGEGQMYTPMVLCIRAVHYLKVSVPVYFTGWWTDVYTYGSMYQGCSLFEGKCTSWLYWVMDRCIHLWYIGKIATYESHMKSFTYENHMILICKSVHMILIWSKTYDNHMKSLFFETFQIWKVKKSI